MPTPEPITFHGLLASGKPLERYGGQRAELGALRFVGRARLDETLALRERLELAPGASDATILLAAYARQGEACLDRIDGEFAFAIHDAASGALFCARDRFGVVPFFHARTGDSLVFGDRIAPLLAHAGTGGPPDEALVADYLVGMRDGYADTFYPHVFALRPGTVLTLRDGTLRERSFYTLAKGAAADAHALRHADEAIAELMARSVRERLRMPTPGARVGAMLSGGLDSSSIAMLAARDDAAIKPVPTFSLVFPTQPALDERPFIDAVLAADAFEPHFIDGEGQDAFGTPDASLDEQEEPFVGYGLSGMRRVYSRAAREGVSVLLDGHGGDEVISHGYGLLNALAAQGSYLRLARETYGAMRVSGQPASPIFLSLISQAGPLARVAGLPARIARRLKLASPPDRTGWRQAVREDVVARTDLVARYNAWRGAGERANRERHLHDLTNPGYARALESLDRTAVAHGIEPRYPFLDRRLAEFCLSLPDEAKLVRGLTRAPLREAMRGVLPEPVRLRRDKIDFTPNFVRSLVGPGASTLDRVLGPEADRIAPYADIDALRAMRARVEQQGDDADLGDATNLWRSAWLSLWLAARERGA